MVVGKGPSPVLMVGLDAAEPRLIERWMGDGTLPNLRRIREAGAYGRLASPAEWLAGSPWPTFYTGTTPADHGYYHVYQWRADRMALARADADWLDLHPFWRSPEFADRRVIALDIPGRFSAEAFNGIEISGWATHDQLARPVSYPAQAIESVRREFGSPPLREEVYGPEPAASLLRQRDELIQATQMMAELAEAFIRRERWDLFLTCFATTHRGGHKLWDESGVRGEAPPEMREELARSLQQIYSACDAAVGRLAAAAGDDATLLVFSLHGMGPNTCRVDLLPEMLKRVLAGGARRSAVAGRENWLKRLRRAVPVEWRQAVKRRLPAGLQDRVTSFWRIGGIDLSAAPAFSIVADLQGYIRINLKGREALGVVEPGEEYDRLCQQIAEGLRSFVDADSAEPLVEEVVRSDRLFSSGRRRDWLPDLVVRWSPTPAYRHREVRSARFGAIAWPTPGCNPDGRSGNHRGEGFLTARGGGALAGSAIENAHVLDLAPTVAALLDLPPCRDWVGRALSFVEVGR